MAWSATAAVRRGPRPRVAAKERLCGPSCCPGRVSEGRCPPSRVLPPRRCASARPGVGREAGARPPVLGSDQASGSWRQLRGASVFPSTLTSLKGGARTWKWDVRKKVSSRKHTLAALAQRGLRYRFGQEGQELCPHPSDPGVSWRRRDRPVGRPARFPPTRTQRALHSLWPGRGGPVP